jgi:hypothetical protein
MKITIVIAMIIAIVSKMIFASAVVMKIANMILMMIVMIVIVIVIFSIQPRSLDPHTPLFCFQNGCMAVSSMGIWRYELSVSDSKD